MNDWAYLIKQRAENARINEIERRAAPLFWLVYLISALFVAWMIVDDLQMRDDRAEVSEALAHAANGKPVAVDSMVMSCKLVPRGE